MIIKLFVLLGLVKFLEASGSAKTCAILYGFVVFIFSIVTNGKLDVSLALGFFGGCLGFVYFWLLHKTANTWLWWLVLIGGLVIGLV